MKLSNVMIASLGAVALMGCDDGDKTPAPVSPPADTVYSVENIVWDIKTAGTASGLSTTAIADIVAYHFDSDSDKVKIYETAYYTTSDYSIEGNESDTDIGEVSFEYENQQVTCDFNAENETLELSNCSVADFNVSGAAGYEPNSDEAKDLVGDIDSKPEEELSGPLNEYTFDQDFDTEPQPLPQDTGSAAHHITNLSTNKVGDTEELVADVVKSAAGVQEKAMTAVHLDQDYIADKDDNNATAYFYYTDSDDTDSARKLTQGSFSIEAVVNRERSSTTQDVALIDYANTDLYKGFKLYIEKDGSTDSNTLKFKVYGGCEDTSENDNENVSKCTKGISTEFVTSNPLVDNVWTHIAGVYDADTNTIEVYVDGKSVGSKAVTFDLKENIGDKFILLGGSNSQDKNFAGYVDNIATWDRALSSDEVAERKAKFTLGGEETPAYPEMSYAWDFSIADHEQKPTAGNKTLIFSKADNTTLTATDGANGDGGAVHLDVSENQGEFGNYYYQLDSTGQDGLNLDSLNFSMEVVFSADDASKNADWFNPKDEIDDPQDLQLLENYNSNTGWKIIIDPSTLLPKFRVYNGTGNVTASATTVLEDSTFMHIVATYERDAAAELGVAKIYINGVLEDSVDVAYSANTKTDDKVNIGGGSTSDMKSLEGVWDQVSFWAEDTLTAEQVATRAAEFGFGVE